MQVAAQLTFCAHYQSVHTPYMLMCVCVCARTSINERDVLEYCLSSAICKASRVAIARSLTFTDTHTQILLYRRRLYHTFPARAVAGVCDNSIASLCVYVFVYGK